MPVSTAELEGVKCLRTLWIGKWWTAGFVDSEEGLSVFGTKSLFKGKWPLFWHRENSAGMRKKSDRDWRNQDMKKVLLLAYFCYRLPAGYDESDGKEGPVRKALCRTQELWTKFVGHMTACQLFSIANLQVASCIDFCQIFSAVSALTDSGQTASCCRSGSKCERAECKVQGSSLLLCFFVLLSVALSHLQSKQINLIIHS